MKTNYTIELNKVIYSIEIINIDNDEITYLIKSAEYEDLNLETIITKEINEIHKSVIWNDSKLVYIKNRPTLVYYDYFKVKINDHFYNIELEQGE